MHKTLKLLGIGVGIAFALSSGAVAQTKKIAYFAAASQNGFNQATYEGVEAKAKELGYETAIFDGQFKADVQWFALEPTAGGWGGRADSDGTSALINLVNGGFRNIPAEVYETKFPVRLEEFSIRADSGGAGRYRGGCGVVRRYKMLEGCYSALWFERSKTPAWGLNGGGDGAGPYIEITLPDGSTEHPLKMRARAFEAGTVFQTMTGGGGGNGNARSRPFDEVLSDVRQGYVSRQAAWDVYGVRINDDLQVDIAACEPRV